MLGSLDKQKILQDFTELTARGQAMAELKSTVTIIPLKGANYPTWSVQCRMAGVKDGLWNIVNQ